MRTPTALLVGLSLVLSLAPTASVRAADSEAERAAKEIADARERANDAATAMFEAESELDRLEIEQESLRQEIAALQAKVGELRAGVEAVAVNRFTRAGTSAMPLLSGIESAGDLAQMDVLIDIVNETSAEDFDVYDAMSTDLGAKQVELEQAEAATAAARAELERRRDAALDEVERLKAVEEQRLKDEAVRKALEAELAQRRLEDEQRAAEQARQQQLQQQQQQEQQRPQQPPPAGNGGNGGNGDAPDPADNDGSGGGGSGSGGSSGGQTGGGGAGGQPSAGAGDFGSSGWVCPVQGSVGFGDTWGAPRSGGRSHQGVDMIGPRGLPIVAVVDGFVQQRTNRLGGNAVWLSGVDGNKYYYAHLDDWGASGSVTAGTVIGTLGDTGNAKFSTPHLHFEIHPGGGAAVNPYPTVRAHC